MGVDSDKSVAVWRSCSGEWFDAELQVERMTMSKPNRACTVGAYAVITPLRTNADF